MGSIHIHESWTTIATADTDAFADSMSNMLLDATFEPQLETEKSSRDYLVSALMNVLGWIWFIGSVSSIWNYKRSFQNNKYQYNTDICSFEINVCNSKCSQLKLRIIFDGHDDKNMNYHSHFESFPYSKVDLLKGI